jgi:hypothetical protein
MTSRARKFDIARFPNDWRGGDHVGPHGFPCRRTKPFPYYIYYQVQDDTIYFLGLVHERRHPDFLKELMAAARKRKQRD